MNEEQLIGQMLGMMPSMTYIVISVVFGLVGLVCFRYGRRQGKSKLLWGGVALMLYPYLIGNDTRLLIIVGAALCGVLYYWRD